MTKAEKTALGYIVAGIVLGLIGVLGDISGWAGSTAFMHAFTAAGGFALGFGVFTLVSGRRKHS